MWTHRYKYKIETPRNVVNRGHIFTGTVQVGKPFSPEEVFELAKRMGNGLFNDSTLLNIQLVETR